MKSIIFTVSILISPFVALCGDGSHSVDVPKECYARFQPSATTNFIHEHRFNFGFLNLGYERIKTDAIYTGFDAKIASLWHVHDEHNVTLDHFVNSEIRLGYNHSLAEKDNITGYAGVGFSMFSVEKEDGKLKNWTYGTLGVKYLHRFGEIFEMGLNLKGYLSINQKRYEKEKIRKVSPSLLTLHHKKENEDLTVEDDSRALATVEFHNTYETQDEKTKTVNVRDTRWLCELGVPMIWHLGEFKNWEIQLEPYYHQIPNVKRAHIIGSRLTFGYRY